MQGEDQKKLDVVSNDVFCNALRSSGRTGTIASEEEDVPVAVEETESGKLACYTTAEKAIPQHSKVRDNLIRCWRGYTASIELWQDSQYAYW